VALHVNRRLALWALAGTGLTAPVAYFLRTRPRNFGVVRDGALYRSGQLRRSAFEAVLAEYRIGTVVTLRPVRDPEENANSDTWEEEVCNARCVRHVRLAPQEVQGEAALDEMAVGFLAVMDDAANHPVLVHCVAGRDRTGTMCAIYRMEYDRWTVDQSLAEMHAFGYDRADLHEHVETYLRAYRPRWQR
jgi:tyrosine-protein phosphatase SIW14